MTVHNIGQNPLHLGLGATVVVEPAMTGDMAWYEGYGQRHGGDGNEGRLVAQHSFTEDWDMWEVHPNGGELVLCTAGSMRLHQEHPDGSVTSAEISAGEYVINEPGVWHTADVIGESATALFITAGMGTDHRPR